MRVTNERFPGQAHKSVNPDGGGTRPPSFLLSQPAQTSFLPSRARDADLHRHMFMRAYTTTRGSSRPLSPRWRVLEWRPLLLFTNLVVARRSGRLAKQHVS